jgi:hypothetical protein
MITSWILFHRILRFALSFYCVYGLPLSLLCICSHGFQPPSESSGSQNPFCSSIGLRLSLRKSFFVSPSAPKVFKAQHSNSDERVKQQMKRDYAGKWRITDMEQWDQDYIDLVAPGHLTIDHDATGSLQFGAVEAEATAGWSRLRVLNDWIIRLREQMRATRL